MDHFQHFFSQSFGFFLSLIHILSPDLSRQIQAAAGLLSGKLRDRSQMKSRNIVKSILRCKFSQTVTEDIGFQCLRFF